jgi:uncharacterized protein Usg
VQWARAIAIGSHASGAANILFSLIFAESGQADFRKRQRSRGAIWAMTETELMLKGYGLTTAEMIYRMPDYRNVLNTFVWQDYDLAPDYPNSSSSSSSGRTKIEGPLHSVRFTHRKMISPGEWRNVTGTFTYH